LVFSVIDFIQRGLLFIRTNWFGILASRLNSCDQFDTSSTTCFRDESLAGVRSSARRALTRSGLCCPRRSSPTPGASVRCSKRNIAWTVMAIARVSGPVCSSTNISAEHGGTRPIALKVVGLREHTKRHLRHVQWKHGAGPRRDRRRPRPSRRARSLAPNKSGPSWPWRRKRAKARGSRRAEARRTRVTQASAASSPAGDGSFC
jgi:hypothetical protein